MQTKSVPPNNFVEFDKFYKALQAATLNSSENRVRLDNLNLYHSDIFYIREALWQKTGVFVSLEDIDNRIEELKSRESPIQQES